MVGVCVCALKLVPIAQKFVSNFGIATGSAKMIKESITSSFNHMMSALAQISILVNGCVCILLKGLHNTLMHIIKITIALATVTKHVTAGNGLELFQILFCYTNIIHNSWDIPRTNYLGIYCGENLTPQLRYKLKYKIYRFMCLYIIN